MKSEKRYSDHSWLTRSILTSSSCVMMMLLLILSLSGFTQKDTIDADNNILESGYSDVFSEMYDHLTTSNFIRDVVNHPAFEGFGELLLPRDDNSRYYDTQLSNVSSLMPYHSHVESNDVVNALNYMIDEVNKGETIFYDFYSNEDKQADPSKENTGIFFYRGNPDAPFAIICPGGGFSYVGSLHEGFPLAQRISELGFNAFVIRYRIGGESYATEDLTAAISYIFHNAESLNVGTSDYSVWGGSAGARMAGDIALSGVSAYGGDDLPKPATVVIAYTGQSTYSSDFSPAFITVAANDGIANINIVERRVENLENAGVDVEYRRYESAGHGFGLGTGTDAEGWVDLAVQFWQSHMMDNQDVSSSSVYKEAISSESEQMTTEDNEVVTESLKISNSRRDPPQTGMTEAVPSEYLTASEYQGSVVRVDYAAKDYVRDISPITKTAYVYLPYGYDENDTDTRYDIIYLMHGFGGRAGEYFDFGNTRNMFDRLIENGDIPPSIIVSATFYTENSETDFSGSVRELREFHQDFTNDLMPAIEGRFHTYAMSTSEEDLAASRDHRAFGGFSLGSVTTWMEFVYDYDYIRYFLPMSGSCWYYGGYGDYYPVETSDLFEELIEENNLNERGYFIYVVTGTQDVVRDQVEIQMEEMLNRSDIFTPDHVVYYQKQDGRHDFEAVQEYLYNALPLFFRD